MNTTQTPREFNVGALADKVAEASLTVRLAPASYRPVLAARLAGLQEAWLLMTRTPEEIETIASSYRSGDQEQAKATVSIVEDETILIAGLVAGGESWIAKVEA